MTSPRRGSKAARASSGGGVKESELRRGPIAAPTRQAGGHPLNKMSAQSSDRAFGAHFATPRRTPKTPSRHQPGRATRRCTPGDAIRRTTRYDGRVGTTSAPWLPGHRLDASIFSRKDARPRHRSRPQSTRVQGHTATRDSALVPNVTALSWPYGERSGRARQVVRSGAAGASARAGVAAHLGRPAAWRRAEAHSRKNAVSRTDNGQRTTPQTPCS